MVERTKLGLIGVGHMGQTHLHNALRSKNARVVAVADKLKKNRKRAEKLGIKRTYKDYSELLDKTELDAVVIALPNMLRVESISKAAEQSIDVFTEKPLCRTMEESKIILGVVEKYGTRVMVNSNCRFFPHVQKLKTFLDEGIIGGVEIATIEHIINGPFTHPLIPRPVPEWWFNKESVGGGCLIDTGYHVLDLFNWLFPKAEVLNSYLSFRFNLDMEDSVSIMVKSKETGTLGMLNAGWFCNALFPRLDSRIIAHGTAGYISTDELKPANLHLHAAKVAFKNLLRRLVFKPIKHLSYTYYLRSHVTALESFIRCLQTDEDFPISLESQIHVIYLIESIYKSQNRRK